MQSWQTFGVVTCLVQTDREELTTPVRQVTVYYDIVERCWVEEGCFTAQWLNQGTGVRAMSISPQTCAPARAMALVLARLGLGRFQCWN